MQRTGGGERMNRDKEKYYLHLDSVSTMVKSKVMENNEQWGRSPSIMHSLAIITEESSEVERAARIFNKSRNRKNNDILIEELLDLTAICVDLLIDLRQERPNLIRQEEVKE